MLEVTRELAKILSTVPCQGDYYATGTADIAMPALEVDGVGRISLPLLPMQAEQLIAVAERSPYGRGGETLLDTAVRRTWQIAPQHVHLSGRGWPGALETIVTRAAAGLGVTGPVSAELYKLLVYDAGSFFVEHRDTEKCSGMFASLVVALPSACNGGELIVRHQGHEVCLDLNRTEPSDVAFAAFYADSVHEVRPVTKGYRLTLIYNLLRTGAGSAPTFQAHTEQSEAIATLLGHRVRGKEAADDTAPEKLIYPLDHAYTPAELAFDALKNADAAAAAILAPAALAADCELHLALVSIEESGSAEHDYAPRGRGRRYRDDDDSGWSEDFEIGEVFERYLSMSHWIATDGQSVAIGALSFVEEELCPPDAFTDREPDEQHFHEANGNEGASFERTYQRAALVLWPRTRKLAVLNQAGLAVTLPYLADLAGRWAQSGTSKDATIWQDAHALSGHMLAQWPATQTYPGIDKGDRETKMLSSLMLLDDAKRIEEFLSSVPAKGIYAGDTNEALVAASALLPSQRAVELVEQIVVRNAYLLPGACANLLARMADLNWFRAAPERSRPAAQACIETLSGERAVAQPPEPWQARCDLDLVTRRTGSPHSLIATKNQASYERRVDQRKDDLAKLALLDATH